MRAATKWSLFMVLTAAITVAALGVAGCGREAPVWEENDKLRIVVSFPPLYSFVTAVAGEDAQVKCLLTNEGPHDYEFKPQDVLLLRKANLFVTNGLGLDDHFTTKMKNACGNPELKHLSVGKCIPKDQLRPMNEHDKHDDQHGHEHGEYDPHFWLGFPEAIRMVECIRDELKKVNRVDEKQAKAYDQRAAEYIEKLKQLHKEGQQALDSAAKKSKKNKKLITFHDSMHYFAEALGLTVVASIQEQPDAEIPSGRLAELARLCRKEEVRIMAVEPQYRDRQPAAEALKDRLKTSVKDPQIIVLDPLETAERKELEEQGPNWYLRKMRENIDQLVESLK